MPAAAVVDAGALADVVPALAPPLLGDEAVVLELELELELEFEADEAAAETVTPWVGTVKPGAPEVLVVPVVPLPQPARASASTTTAAVPEQAAGRMARVVLTSGSSRSRAAPCAGHSVDSR